MICSASVGFVYSPIYCSSSCPVIVTVHVTSCNPSLKRISNVASDNGNDVVVPMVIEEPSVVAAASNAARIAREGGGFTGETDAPIVAAQVQLLDVEDRGAAIERIRAAEQELLALADGAIPGLITRGGGARAMEIRVLGEPSDRMLVVDIFVDCRDAMGANLVNSVAEVCSCNAAL